MLDAAPLADEQIGVVPDLRGKSVAIVAMGPSHWEYVGDAVWKGHRHAVADEVWGINYIGGSLICDRIVAMDNLARALVDEGEQWRWIHEPGPPIYTAAADPAIPRTVTYPLEAVLNEMKAGYFNTSTAYALALAAAGKPKRIHMFGTDFTKVEGKVVEVEEGRGCVEFWVGFITRGLGIEVTVARTSQLMDMNKAAAKRFYGYATHGIHVDVAKHPDGRFEVIRRPLEA